MKNSKVWKVARIWAPFLAGISVLMLLLIAAFGGFSPKNNTTATAQETPVNEVAVGIQKTGAETVPKAEGDFIINMPSRDGNRLNADGVEIPGNTEALREQMAEQAKRDPLTLFAYYMASPLGDIRPFENESAFAEGGIIKNGNAFSQEGIRAYQEWVVFWETADLEAVSEIRFQAINTGVTGVRLTQSRGVGGYNKSGFNVAYRDVNGRVTHQHSILNRCAQPTFGEPISWAPKGPTDSTPPTRPREEPPPPTRPTPPKGGNPFPGFVREHQRVVPLPPTTPGYTPGNAEEIREEQNRQPVGGLDPTPSGTPGTGSGGVTPPGQTQNPDGSLIVAPPPSSLPPAPPPPLSEVETGAGLPPKPN